MPLKVNAQSDRTKTPSRSNVNSQDEAALTPLGCLLDHVSVKWFRGILRGAVNLIPSPNTGAEMPGCEELGFNSAGGIWSRIRRTPHVTRATAEVEFQVPPVGFLEALALAQGLEVVWRR